MLGATFFGAVAQDAVTLSSYPAPFVKDGVLNAQFVIGENAKVDDVGGVIDVATNLQSEAVTKSFVSTGGSTGTTLSEGYQVRTASTAVTYGVTLNSVKSQITSTDWSFLKDTTLVDTQGSEYTVQQLITPPRSSVTYGRLSGNVDSNEIPVLYLPLSVAAADYYNRSIRFPTGANFSAAAGQAITLFGKEFQLGESNDNNLLAATPTFALFEAAVDREFVAGDNATINVGGTE